MGEAVIKVKNPTRFVMIVLCAIAFYAFGDGSLAGAFLVGTFVGSFKVEFR